ncbi:MAG: hypothetical protein LC750_18100 [Actinobacteria bacterium]|nr:hypothetical protein [Actinomycetota bacterium]
MLEDVWNSGRDPTQEPFFREYLSSGTKAKVYISPGVTVEGPFTRDTIGLLLAEFYQNDGRLERAIEVVGELSPNSFVMVSLAELYGQAGMHDKVIGLTDGVKNDDDATALLCVFRGAAFRNAGQLDAARTVLTHALKSRSRNPIILHKALFERALTYEGQGKLKLARKQLEKILAEDSRYPGVVAKLGEMSNALPVSQSDQ